MYIKGNSLFIAVVTTLAVMTSNVSLPRLNVAYVKTAGEVAYAASTPAVQPVTLTPPTDGMKLSEVNMVTDATNITNENIKSELISKNFGNIAKYTLVDLQAFGVKGDGVTDDTSTLEAAISYAVTNHAWLDLSNLTLKITRQINIPNGILLLKGKGATIKPVIAADNLNHYWFDNHTATDLQVYIEGIIFDGSNIPVPSVTASRIPLCFQSTSNSPVKSITINRCKFVNMLHEEQENTTIDHAIRILHANNVQIKDCIFENVKGWSTYLEDVNGFEISGNKSNGNYQGAIVLRGSCRNGTVHDNIITNCNGKLSAAIDMLGMITYGLSENVHIYNNLCHGQFVYNVGLRVKSARNVMVHDNTVILDKEDVTGGRYGVVVSSKGEIGAMAIVENIVVENNTIVTSVGSNSAVGILCYNDAPDNTPCKNIYIRNNKIIENGGKFLIAGIKIQQSGGTISAIENIHIENNRISASLSDKSSGSLGGITIQGHTTDITHAIKKLSIKDNIVVNSGNGKLTNGCYITGIVVEGEIQRNTFNGYYYPINADKTKLDSVNIANNFGENNGAFLIK